MLEAAQARHLTACASVVEEQNTATLRGARTVALGIVGNSEIGCFNNYC